MENHQILKELHACAVLCNICYSSCLKEPHVDMMRDCITLDRECADICLLAASYFARSSANTWKLLQLCADICLQCAEACEKHDHEHCRKCAMACRTCYEMCRTYQDEQKLS